jgi:hypothetical protein
MEISSPFSLSDFLSPGGDSLFFGLSALASAISARLRADRIPGTWITMSFSVFIQNKWTESFPLQIY